MRAATLLLLAVWPALSPAASVPESVAECLRTIEAREPPPGGWKEGDATGRMVSLPASCPGLVEALEASPYGQWMPRGWSKEETTLAQLRELERLLTAADSGASTDLTPPDETRVAGVLRELQNQESQKKRSLWERFTAWLAERMQPKMGESPSWLQKLLSRLNFSNAGAEDVARLLLLLVVAGAVVAIINELRTAGVLRRKRGALAARANAGTVIPGGAGAEIDVDAVELRQRPSLLLDLVLEKQAAHQPEAGDASLTHRELGTAVKLPDAERQQDFTRLASCAERTRYAEADPAESELTEAVAAGRRLLAGFTPA